MRRVGDQKKVFESGPNYDIHSRVGWNAWSYNHAYMPTITRPSPRQRVPYVRRATVRTLVLSLCEGAGTLDKGWNRARDSCAS